MTATPIALALEAADAQQILGIDVVRGPRVARMALRDPCACSSFWMLRQRQQRGARRAAREDHAAHSRGYSADRLGARSASSSSASVRAITAARPQAPAGQGRDDRDLVAVLQRRVAALQRLDRLAVDVDVHVVVHLARARCAPAPSGRRSARSSSSSSALDVGRARRRPGRGSRSPGGTASGCRRSRSWTLS